MLFWQVMEVNTEMLMVKVIEGLTEDAVSARIHKGVSLSQLGSLPQFGISKQPSLTCTKGAGRFKV